VSTGANREAGGGREPSLELISSLLFGVSECLFGFPLQPEPELDETALRWRAAALDIPAAKDLKLVLATDRESAETLSMGMLHVKREALETSLIEDVLRELVNMVGGHLKAALAIDEVLALPEIVSEEQQSAPWHAPRSEHLVLSGGPIRVCVWLTHAT